MKNFLEKKIGEKIGVIRAGMPKEVYFEARLTAVDDEVAVFMDDAGREIALPWKNILVIGQPESEEPSRTPVGFAKNS